MIGTSHTVSILGVQGLPIRVEVAILSGLPNFTIVGLPDAAVSESRERIRAAFAAARISFPAGRVTVNLSPADTPKVGTAFDVAIAAAILAAQAHKHLPPGTVFLGELGLDGSVRPVRGVLPCVLGAAHHGFQHAIVPHGCGAEAELAQIQVGEIWHITQIAQRLGAASDPVPPPPPVPVAQPRTSTDMGDLSEVRGQYLARHALEIAAAGSHHLLMIGAPGVGKSMLATRLPGIMPPLTRAQAVESASIRSIVGQFEEITTRPPYVAPHHTSSATALVGGGSRPRPGAISLAHHGVLFLDELPEFTTRAIQSLREPMESGEIHIHRAQGSVCFPARFQLVAAGNPCRCGRLLDSPTSCTCSGADRAHYQHRIGGPLRDRIDLMVNLPRPSRAELAAGHSGDSSETVAARVREARERQHYRFRGETWDVNAAIPGTWLRAHTQLAASSSTTLSEALTRGLISMRAADKILRVAWTLADLAGHTQPTTDDVAGAFALRGKGNSGYDGG
ncbi:MULTISPECIES: YifB family Mg chelatase-like AAA ATPase [Actinotignum]|uniref:YifB family Mg chelatase-like AAA ATPase n=3 Tax=Actinomycetaceae TaxID=2049 RepID=UPI00254E52C8|nr:YifB family Mg chelatase-like AAA ATPase [Actinotignum schaalii]MDK7271453.1 YifB family Mg chelatase-like AAA ATPase [Actinotignum schaalii]